MLRASSPLDGWLTLKLRSHNGADLDMLVLHNKRRVLLGRATGYFGVTNYMGDRFANSDDGMNAFLTVLRQRGVAFLDDGSMSRRPGAWARASANRIIDEEQNPTAIVGQLNALEALAKAPAVMDRARELRHQLGNPRVLMLGVVLYRGMSGQFSAKHHDAVEAVSLYWHFVDVVWILLFTILYLL